MINHVRTLLLNADGSAQYPKDYPGEEFVDPSYRASQLPPPLAAVRQAIFGLAPDRAMMNFRLRQLAPLLHATELAGHATAFDPRVTYWPPRDSAVFETLLLGPTAVQLAGQAQTMYVTGTPPAGLGRLFYQWRVDVGATAAVVTTLTGPAVSTSTTFDQADGLGGPVPLAGSTLSVFFALGDPASYVVSALVPPATSLLSVAEGVQGVMDTGARVALFGGTNPAEPFLTFANLWDSNRQLPYRLGGLVTALAYRTQALRG